MTASKNIIRKQAIHFRYNGNADGIALQKEVSDWCTLKLIPQIELQLENFVPDDEYITIDKLEINADIDKADWQQKIQDALMTGLNKKLSNYIPVVGKQEDKKETIAKKLDGLILFYFEKGYLPWWGKAFIADNFETVLYNWIKEDKQQSQIEMFSKQLQLIASEAVIKRILNNIPDNLFFQFIKNIFKNDAELIGETEAFFKEIMTDQFSVTKKKEILKPVYHFILKNLIINTRTINIDLMLRLVYKELQQQKLISHIVPIMSSKQGGIINPVKKTWQELLLQQKVAAKKDADSKHQPVEKKTSNLKYKKSIEKIKDPAVETAKKLNTDEDLQEGVYIDNAGVVIVAAFLPALFQKLKIVKDGSMSDSEMAALLIQFIVTGNTKIAEFELVLPKILCGIDLELPVNTNKKITNAQKKEVDEMLKSVIEYWAVIKDTSIQGLRESFLQRTGKLSLVNNEWLLQVEQKSFDMLLQQLPWSISMIKLPWMKILLKTEWI